MTAIHPVHSYQLILWDLNGVLVPGSVREKAMIQAITGRDPQTIGPILDAHNQALELGVMSEEECLRQILLDLGVRVTQTELREAHTFLRMLRRRGMRPFPCVQAVLANYRRRGVHQWTISNIGPDGRRIAAHLGLFPAHSLASYQIGKLKPDPEFFAIVVKQMADHGISPADTLYVDDTADNLVTAQAFDFPLANLVHIARDGSTWSGPTMPSVAEMVTRFPVWR